MEFTKAVYIEQNFKKSLFRKVLEKLFAFKQKYEEKCIDLMQGLVQLTMNSLYGVQIRKDIDEFCESKSEHWLQTEDDYNVLRILEITKWKLYSENKKI